MKGANGSKRRAGLRLGLVAGALIAAAACSSDQNSVITSFLESMQELAQAPRLSVDRIESTLGLEFTKDDLASHESVTFLVGKPLPRTRSERLIGSADCRVPTPQNTAMSELFLVIELRDSRKTPSNQGGAGAAVELRRKDVVAKFGRPDSFEPSLPENPNSSGTLIYKIGIRALWFSLGREDEDRVFRVSIHSLEDSREP